VDALADGPDLGSAVQSAEDFVASAPLRSDATAFLARVPNLCVQLPVDPDAFDALARRRAMGRSSAWATKLTSASRTTRLQTAKEA